MTVTGVNDDLDDGDIAYSIVTAARDQRGWRSTTGSNRGRRQRHEHRQRRLGHHGLDRSAARTTEAGGTATFTVVLDAPADRRRDVGLSTSDATEGTVLPGVADLHDRELEHARRR